MVGTVTNLPSFIATPASRTQDGTKPVATPDEPPRRDAAVAADVAADSYRSDVIAAREDVAAARSALDLFIAVAKEVRSLLLEARDLASKSAAPETPDAARAAQDVPFRGLVQSIARLVDDAVSRGASALAGGAVSVDADPDAPGALKIAGLDLRMKTSVGDADALRLTSASSIADADGAVAAALAADESIRRIDAGLQRIEAGAFRLDGHDAVLSRLDAALAGQVRVDYDAEAARLIALQVRQELTRASSPIANAAPSQVLALFRD